MLPERNSHSWNFARMHHWEADGSRYDHMLEGARGHRRRSSAIRR